MELIIGRVAKPHGITGELSVEVRTDDPDDRFAPGVTLRARGRDGRRADFTVEQMRPHGGRVLLRLAGVGDRTAAEALRGHLFVIDTGELPPIDEPDTYYDHELEGLTVVTTTGVRVGSVSEVLHTAAGELLAVRRVSGAEVLIPFVSAIVTSVSPVDELIEIEPPDGLLELDD